MTARTRLLIAATLLNGAALTALAQSEPRPAQNFVRTEQAFPTGDRASSLVLLERTAPTEVRLGEAFTYQVKLTNLTRSRIEELTLTETFPAHLRVTGLNPRPARSDATSAAWNIAALEPGGVAFIQVTGSTDQRADLVGCANVTFKTALCSTTRIVEPRLIITKSMPAQVTTCDEIAIKIVVGNNGSGVARGVRVSDNLPAGLATRDGQTGFVLDAGDLAPGQGKEFTIITRAARAGEYRNTARASETGGPTVEASAITRVRQPVLAVSKRGPNLRYLGRSAQFEIVVQNTGDAPANDTILTETFPAGWEVVGVEAEGRLSGNQIVWSLGTLAPGAAKTVRVNFKPGQIGQYVNTAVAKAYCAEASASASLDVMGIPAVLLEVVDLEDPDEVGTTETYVISVTNQGTANATNIRVVAEIQPEAEYVSSTGATTGGAAGNTVTFAPLASIAPKGVAEWRVVVKGMKAGDTRFKVTLTTEQTEQTGPIQETESTRFYE